MTAPSSMADRVRAAIAWFRDRPSTSLLLAFVASLIASLLVVDRLAARSLDARARALRAEIASFVKSHPPERARLFSPALEGNAADDWRRLTSVYLAGGVCDPSSPSHLPAIGGPTFAPLFKELEGAGEEIRAPGVRAPRLSTPSMALLDKAQPWLHIARRAAQRDRCRWDHPYRYGVAPTGLIEIAPLHGLRRLLAFEASIGSTRVATDKGLLIWSCGRDIGRQPMILTAMIGMSLEGTALDVLRAALRRGASGPDCRRMIAALSSPPGLEMSAVLAGERILGEVTIAQFTGRLLPEEEGYVAERYLSGFGSLFNDILPRLSIVMHHEGTEYRRLFMRGSAASTLPEPGRTRAFAALEAEREASWSPAVRRMMPDLKAVARELDRHHALRDLVLIGAAARLFESENGRPAQRLEELAGALPPSVETAQIQLEVDSEGVSIGHRVRALGKLTLPHRGDRADEPRTAPPRSRPR